MTQRITDQMLQVRLDTVNNLRGHRESGFLTPGVIRLEKAYGGTAVSIVVNKEGGVSMLLPSYGTKREAYIFLGGMVEALYLPRRGV